MIPSPLTLLSWTVLPVYFDFFSFFSDITHNMFGKFHFVDLAGSERAHRTGNVGDRFKGRYLTEQKIILIK